MGPEDKLNLGVERRNKLLSARLLGETSKISLRSIYIQNSDFARKMMSWLNGFIGEERMRLEMKTFATPHLQIGDIVSIDYDIPYADEDEYDSELLSNWNPTRSEYIKQTFKFYGNGKKFVVRKMGVDVSTDGPEYNLSLVEIPNKTDWRAGDW